MPTRSLTAKELQEAQLVFGDGLDYAKARVTEGEYFPPNFIADIGAFFQGQKRTWDNAITIGNTVYFPRYIKTDAETIDVKKDLTDIGWLMHELTHVWQFQQIGWRYLQKTISVQMKLGMAAYNYNGKHGSKKAALKAAHAEKRRLMDFNFEQQGDIARDYYWALKANDEPETWRPFINELGKQGRKVDTGKRDDG